MFVYQLFDQWIEFVGNDVGQVVQCQFFYVVVGDLVLWEVVGVDVLVVVVVVYLQVVVFGGGGGLLVVFGVEQLCFQVFYGFVVVGMLVVFGLVFYYYVGWQVGDVDC